MKSLFVFAIFSLLGSPTLSAEPDVAPPTKKIRKATYLETGGERKLDVVYKKVGERELQLDLYYPTGKQSKKAPTIIYTHGGGWAAGSRAGAAKGSFSSLFKQLLKEGFAVASVDYRLARKESGVAMRDCVIDSKDAARYLAKNSEVLGLNREKFYTFGDSAGGHIAQMLLLTSPSSLAGDAKLAEVPYKIVAGVSWYGPCDFEDISLFNHDDRPDFRDRFGPRILGYGEVTPEEKLRLYREMSPITYLKKESPPLFMIQGDKDTTIPAKHALRMEKRAKELQAPVETLIVKNSGHNWRKIDTDILPSRNEIIQATAAFFVEQKGSTATK
ncbi:alpha/beta hydrolase [Akkermansiaceae bacterium]|nr:alpha/beta hydrolase [Akkermansiaceae bacterium]